MRYLLIPAIAAFLMAIAPHTANSQETIVVTDYSNNLTNPYFPLSTLHRLEYEGSEPGEGSERITTSGVLTILTDDKIVAGVSVLVVRDQAYADGELVEETLDYYAQHRDGTVYYFGEDVDNYENGVLVDHDGSWLAGTNGALPGVFMPAQPTLGQKFDQERAPGIAEDQSEVIETGLTLNVAAGAFNGCIETEDYDPIGDGLENKFYCPGVGLVREEADDEEFELQSYTLAPAPVATATPLAPAPTAVFIATPTGATGVVAPDTGSGAGKAGAVGVFAIAAVMIAAGALLVVKAGRSR